MLYLAIDPGDTTGLCLVHYFQTAPFNKIKSLISLPWEDAQKQVYDWVDYAPDIFLIFERSPEWKATSQQKEKVLWVTNIGKHLFEVMGTPSFCVLSPGDWKPVAKARKWKHPKAKDQHQADAFNLFRYYIWRSQKYEVPYLPIEEGDKP